MPLWHSSPFSVGVIDMPLAKHRITVLYADDYNQTVHRIVEGYDLSYTIHKNGVLSVTDTTYEGKIRTAISYPKNKWRTVEMELVEVELSKA
jgi:hypothetical protein